MTVRTFNWEYRIRLGILAYTIEFRSPIKTYNLPPLKYQVLPLKLSVSDVADEVCAACLPNPHFSGILVSPVTTVNSLGSTLIFFYYAGGLVLETEGS